MGTEGYISKRLLKFEFFLMSCLRLTVLKVSDRVELEIKFYFTKRPQPLNDMYILYICMKGICTYCCKEDINVYVAVHSVYF